MLISEGGWTVDLLAYNGLIRGLIYASGLNFVLRRKWKKGSFHKIFLLGQIGGSLTLFGYSIFFFLRFLPISFIFFMKLMFTFVGGLSFDLLYLPLMGRVSKHLPEGFESTGITLFLALLNTTSSVSRYVEAKQLKAYNVYKGYYDRAMTPYLINLATSVGAVVLSPIFLMWE